MADLFGKIKKGIDKGIHVASQKSGELVETGKLQSQIISLKNDKKSSINELGKLTYEMLKSDSFELEVLEEKFKEILEIEKEIEQKEEAKKNVDQKETGETEEVEAETVEMSTCPKCGAENPADAMFCGKCGTKLGEEAEEAEETE
ncbi:replication restart DNA helicase PriA [Dethiosulfatibacter aminovorans DSM 17477]|uniref:Replication restart DNA helicase PriA n=1 Tax=Dethiosulfatibacter aminovorans DSM 17477 TaxID=1121476 RepID=A0A1M6C800_9FIRM|nr:zinc ribbon domain-containing protein [Dethiosulfatibacter aminovorans]SHI57136.1 replication restart DNA helicase PriA [Dethiosulfatibacter aminovorans DSM 17477]